MTVTQSLRPWTSASPQGKGASQEGPSPLPSLSPGSAGAEKLRLLPSLPVSQPPKRPMTPSRPPGRDVASPGSPLGGHLQRALGGQRGLC